MQLSVHDAEHFSAGSCCKPAMMLCHAASLAGVARQHGGELSQAALSMALACTVLAAWFMCMLCACSRDDVCRTQLLRTASGDLHSSSACSPLVEAWLQHVEEVIFCTRESVALAFRAPALFWNRSCAMLRRTTARGPSWHRIPMMIMGQDGHVVSAQELCASCGVPGRRTKPSGVKYRPS